MKVFLSYRRADSAALAGRLADALQRVRGVEAVFHDVDTIPPGRDFAGFITERLADATHVWVLIGPGWLAATGTDGRPRLFADDDLVRHEVARALAGAPACTTVPVLVDGTPMPRAEQLPPELAALPRTNAFELRTAKFRTDFHELMTRLLGHPPEDVSEPPERLGAAGGAARAAGGAALGFAVFLGFSAFVQLGLGIEPARFFGMPGDDETAARLWVLLAGSTVAAGALLPFAWRALRRSARRGRAAGTPRGEPGGG